MRWPLHGSNPHYLYKSAGITQPNQIIDFSANINPLGPPASIYDQWDHVFQEISHYPDQEGSLLKKKLVDLEGIGSEQLLVGNGGAELISLIGRFVAGKKVMIIQPSFSEYEKACLMNHCKVSFFQLTDSWNIDIALIKEKVPFIDAIFLSNPNNPTGLYYKKDIIIDILNECQKQNCLLIVDEAFYDFVEEYESLVPLLKDYKNFIILRSMTKMFSIPGLRLGYVMANCEIIANLSNYQPHWSVNSLALNIGNLCLHEETFIKDTLQFISVERNKLFQFFKQAGFDVSNSKVNFYLLKDHHIDDQYPFFEFLLKKGIVPRHTYNFPGLEGRWLRFAVKNKEENMKLMEAIQEWRKIQPSFL